MKSSVARRTGDDAPLGDESSKTTTGELPPHSGNLPEIVPPLFDFAPGGEALVLGEDVRVIELRSFAVQTDPDSLLRCCQSFFGTSLGVRPHDDLVWFDELAMEFPGTPGARAARCVVVRLTVTQPAMKGTRHAFCPFTFVDDSGLVARLREAFGVPALFARFVAKDSSPNGGTPVRRLDVAAEVHDGNAGAPEMATVLSVEFERGEQKRLIKNAPLPFLQFKQMRDAADPTRACLQDLVHGSFSLDSVDARQGRARITAHDVRTLELAGALGLTSGKVAEGRDAFVTDAPTFFKIAAATEESAPSSPRNAQPARLPDFRQRYGDPQVPPPYSFRDVEIVGYRIPVRLDILENICHRTLNARFPGRGYEYVPVAAQVIMEVLRYGVMTGPPLPGNLPGDYSVQNELVFRILVGKLDDDGSGIASDPRVFSPLIFVDDAISCASGREVVGYPKVMAAFGTDHIDVDGVPIVEVEPPTGPSEPAHDGARGWLWHPADLEHDKLDPDAFTQRWMGENAHGYGTIQLKQIVDASHPGVCRVQELVYGRFSIRDLAVQFQRDPVSLRLHPQIAEAFAVPQDLVIPSDSWYRASCGFDLRIESPLDP